MQRKKSLSIFSLVMINVIAVDSLRSLPVSAEYGFSSVFYYLLAGLFFFIPAALVAAELATGWPQKGGIYVWVREAFGLRLGFLVIWLQWVYNVVWYPTIMSFIAVTMAYLIDPNLAHSKVYVLSSTVILFWFATFLNFFGMRLSSWVSIIGAIIGTLLPMLVIISLGVLWIGAGNPIQIKISPHTFLPDLSSPNNLAFLTAVLFGLIGIEMSAVHADEVQNPRRDYPKALFISTLIILGSLIFASLAIAIVIPQKNINLISGLLDAFKIFLNAFGLSWMLPFLAIMIVLGSLSGVSAWLIGPTKGLLVCARDGGIPHFFQQTNRYGVPVRILLVQAIIVTILAGAFVLLPTLNSAYWILSDLTAQLALIVYVFMLAAVVRLRYKAPDVERTFAIGGGRVGVWLVAGCGILSCIVALVLGFFPPSQINVGNHNYYELMLCGGMLLACFPVLLVRKNLSVS